MWYGTQESYLQYIHIKLNDQYKQTDVYLLKSIFTSTCIDYSMYFNVFKNYPVVSTSILFTRCVVYINGQFG